MKIIKLMVCEFIEQLKNNLITTVLMSVVSVILVVFVSVYSFQYNKYKPFKNLNFEKGFFVTHNGNLDAELDKIDGIDKIYGLYKDQGMVSEENANFSIIGYEKWIWENKPGHLIQGDWFSQETINRYQKQNKIPVVLGGETDDYKVGDCMNLYLCSNYFDEEVENVQLSFYVTGILSKDAGVIGDNGRYNVSNTTYEAFYDTADEMSPGIDGKIGTVLFVPIEAVLAQGIDLRLASKFFIKYNDLLNDEEIAKLNGELYAITDGTGVTMSDFRQWSEDKLKNTLMTYVPFLVIGLVIIMLSVYSLANISVTRQTKHMGIFTLVGASRLHNFFMLFSNAIGTIIISVILSTIGIVFYGRYALEHNIYFDMNNICVVAIAIAYVFFFVFMSFSMYLAFRKKTTRGILISLHK